MELNFNIPVYKLYVHYTTNIQSDSFTCNLFLTGKMKVGQNPLLAWMI